MPRFMARQDYPRSPGQSWCVGGGQERMNESSTWYTEHFHSHDLIWFIHYFPLPRAEGEIQSPSDSEKETVGVEECLLNE